jgi:hypothetical protein
MISKTIKLVSLATTIGVAVSLVSVVSTAQAQENPTQMVGAPTYQISPSGPGKSLSIRLNGARAVQTGQQVVVVGSDEKVIETLPESILLPTGQVARTSYDVSDPQNIRVSLVNQVTDPDVAGDGLGRRSVRSVKWDDSWDKCVSGAGLNGAIVGGLGGVALGPAGALAGASLGMVVGGISSMAINCAGKPRMQ